MSHIAECKTLVTIDEDDCDCFSIYRLAIIEECARAVESWTMHRGYNMDVAAELAAAIRALKGQQ